jgi:hypothetical protein
MKKIPGLIFFTLMMSFLMNAQQKKTIQVVFEVKEEAYVMNYGSADIGKMSQKCALQIAALLNDKFPLFRFSTKESPQKLLIFLTSKEKSSVDKLHEVGFKMLMKGSDTDNGSGTPLYWTFRPVSEYTLALPDSVNTFADEVVMSFTKNINADQGDIVGKVLSRVEVADDYFVLTKKLNNKTRIFYIAPVNRDDYRIKKYSEFRVVTTMSDDIMGYIENDVVVKVINYIRDIQVARSKYHLPLTYPELSIVMTPEAKDEQPVDSVGTGVLSKKVYLLNYLPLQNTELELSTPVDLSNNSNQD